MSRSETDDLARAIYPIIRPYAERLNASVAYGEVCRNLGGRWAGLDPHSNILASALGCIVGRCRDAGFPALSALVVHAGDDKRPGNGYYEAAHPGIDDPLEREVAWAKEFEAVHRANYPANFDDL